MPLHIDGQEVHIGEFGMSQFNKADVEYAFNSFGNEKIVFNKKGSELKGILHEKKRQLEDAKSMHENKMAILREDMGERKSGSREGEVDNVENNISYELTDDSVENATEEEKLAIQTYRKCAYKCMAICKDLKVVNTMIKHLEDSKSYKVNLQQMNTIEKAEQFFMKASEASQAKVEKVMRDFKEGKLKDSDGNRVSDRKQAIAIAMSEAGLDDGDIEKFYPTGEPSQSRNNAAATDTLTKKREMEKSDDMNKAFDDLFEKANYKNNAENRRLGRVGKQYGGKKSTQSKKKTRGDSGDLKMYKELLSETNEMISDYEDSLKDPNMPKSDKEMGKHELSKLKKEKVLQEKIVKELSGDKENAKPDVSARSNRKSGSKELKISDINNILSDAGFVQNSSTINSSAMGKLEKLVKLLNNRMGLKSDDDKMSVWYIPEASQYAINRGIDRQKWKRNEYGIMERYYDNILGFKSDGQSMESIDASFLKQKLSDTYYPLKKSDDVSKAFDDLLEKGTYKNNAENRKLGRVGNTYGGAKEKQAEARSNRTGASAINIENVRNMMTQSDIKHNSPIGVTGALEKLRKLSTLINKQMGLKSDDEKVSAHYLPEARSYVLNRGVNAHKWRATQHGIRERYVDNIISFKSDSYTTESIDPIVLSDFLKRTYKDDSLEKGIYVNNAENRKEGRVGQKYGGKKEMSQGNARAYREGGKPDESKNQIKIGRNIGGDDLKGVSLANKEDRHKHILSKMGVFAIGGVVQLYDMKNGFSGAVKIVSKDGDKFTGYRVNDLATPNGTEEWKAKRNMQIFTRENATHFRMGRTSHATKEAVDNYIGRFKKYDDIEEPKK